MVHVANLGSIGRSEHSSQPQPIRAPTKHDSQLRYRLYMFPPNDTSIRYGLIDWPSSAADIRDMGPKYRIKSSRLPLWNFLHIDRLKTLAHKATYVPDRAYVHPTDVVDEDVAGRMWIHPLVVDLRRRNSVSVPIPAEGILNSNKARKRRTYYSPSDLPRFSDVMVADALPPNDGQRISQRFQVL